MKLKLTNKQVHDLTTFLFEYGQICYSDSDVGSGSNYKSDKSLTCYKVAKRIDKILDIIYKQVDPLKLTGNDSR